MSASDIDETDRTARLPLIIISAMTIIALILGIATGSIGEHTFKRPPPATSITIP
jgi:hypothetical protein